MNFQVNNNQKGKYDLEERTANFAETIIDLVKKIPITSINKSIIEQLVKSSGSIGANYSEATEGQSKRDFIHKIGISKKEVKESKHWLRLLARANPEFKDTIQNLWKENHELLLIFSKILRSSRSPV